MLMDTSGYHVEVTKEGYDLDPKVYYWLSKEFRQAKPCVVHQVLTYQSASVRGGTSKTHIVTADTGPVDWMLFGDVRRDLGDDAFARFVEEKGVIIGTALTVPLGPDSVEITHDVRWLAAFAVPVDVDGVWLGR